MSKSMYKIDNNDKVRVWKAWTEGSNVIAEYGVLDGKMQQEVYQAEPKNIGKVNETSAEEQAVIEVEAMYTDRETNKHYRYSVEQAQEVKNANLIPRKILNYKDGWKKLPETCISSVKLNGSRACIMNGDLYSKIGRPEEIKHKLINQGVQNALELGFGNLDCEVYAHGLSLQRIRSAWLKPVKTDKEVIKVANDRFGLKGKDRITCVESAINKLGYNPNHDAQKLKLHVFDIPCRKDRPFKERLAEVEAFKGVVSECTVLQNVFEFCDYHETYSHEERVEKLAIMHDQGFEGYVHYDPDGVYEFGKRSSNTQKAKPRFMTEGFVTGVELCKNGEGKLVIQCTDQFDNQEIKCMMKGTREERDFEAQKYFIGKWVTFEYEDVSDKNKPLKPVAHEERKCDDSGSPLE